MSRPLLDIVQRPFLFNGRDYKPGEAIEINNPGRREQLLEQRVIRRMEMNEQLPAEPEAKPAKEDGPLPQAIIDEALAILTADENPEDHKPDPEPEPVAQPESSEPEAKPRKRSRQTEEAKAEEPAA